MSRCLLLFVVCVFLPVLVLCEPDPDDLELNQCLSEKVTIGPLPLQGFPRACVIGTISRCDSFNVSLRITVGNTINQTINISRGGNVDPALGFSIPSQICTNNARATFHFDTTVWKFTPSYVRIKPYVQFDTDCTISTPLGSTTISQRDLPMITREFSVGTDCSLATTCSACAERTAPGFNHPCGWCHASQTCFAENPQTNQPYCAAPCATTGGLFTTNAQCTAAQQAQSTSDSAWSAGKTATVVVLAIVLPILVIIVALCLRRSYNRHRAQKGTTSGVGSIQAHTQGYRPTSESVSTEVSANASTTAEFRQLEGYNPPSSRDSHV